MATSDSFTIYVRSQSILAEAAAALTSGWSAPLTVPSLSRQTYRDSIAGQRTYPDTACVYDDDTGLPRTKRAWNWSGKACWDSVEHRIVFICSPFIELDFPVATMLSVYDEWTSHFYVLEDPLNGYSVGHTFDCNAIDVTGRRLYKWTAPYAPGGGVGYLQPQLGVLNLDNISATSSGLDRIVSRAPDGADPDLDMRNTTAPGMDWFPGVGLVLFSKNRYWILDVTTDTWGPRVDLPVDTPTIHNLCHYHPTLNSLIFGGGALNIDGDTDTVNYQFFRMDSQEGITELDNSPVGMSVANHTLTGSSYPDRKCCATYIPNDNRSVFFHCDGNVYALDPSQAGGSQWSVIGAMDQDEGTVNDRWCCPIDDYGCIAVGHFGWDGDSKIRLWKP